MVGADGDDGGDGRTGVDVDDGVVGRTGEHVGAQGRT